MPDNNQNKIFPSTPCPSLLFKGFFVQIKKKIDGNQHSVASHEIKNDKLIEEGFTMNLITTI